jgi:hypothetical protein
VPPPVVRATTPALAPPQGICPAPRRARRGQRLRRQGRTLRELAELGEGLLLQLPDALPAQAEHIPNLLEALRLARVQPVAQPQNQGLALGQVPEAGVHAAAHLLRRQEILRRRGLRIL